MLLLRMLFQYCFSAGPVGRGDELPFCRSRAWL